MDFDLRHLAHVHALAEHRSFAKAAASLGLSQPALSRSVQELERRLGVTLFTRRRDGVDPTDAGRVLLKRAEELLSGADELNRHLRLMRGLEIGTLRIGAGIYPSEMFVAAAIARMVREHPGIAIDVRTRNPDEHFAALRRHEIDVAVVEAPWAQTQPDFDVTVMSWHQGYCVVRPQHPLCSLHMVTWREVLAHPLALSARVPPEILSELHQAAANPTDVRLLGCDSPTMMKVVAEGSDAVAILPQCVMRREIADGSLVKLPLETPWLGRAFGLVRLRGRPMAGAEGVFAGFVLDADREAHESAPRPSQRTRDANPAEIEADSVIVRNLPPRVGGSSASLRRAR